MPQSKAFWAIQKQVCCIERILSDYTKNAKRADECWTASSESEYIMMMVNVNPIWMWTGWPNDIRETETRVVCCYRLVEWLLLYSLCIYNNSVYKSCINQQIHRVYPQRIVGTYRIFLSESLDTVEVNCHRACSLDIRGSLINKYFNNNYYCLCVICGE